jgi:hypothetical protein
LAGGTVLISNGCTKGKTTCQHKLVCNQFRVYKPQKRNKENNEKKNKSPSLDNDIANNQEKEGRLKGSRRTSTRLPITDDARCAMKLSVMDTSDGFNFVGASGCACHANQNRFNKDHQRTVPTSLLKKAEQPGGPAGLSSDIIFTMST